MTSSLGNAAAYENFDLLANFKTDGGVTQGVTVARIHCRMTRTSALTSGDVYDWGIFRGQNADVGLSVVGAPNASADPYEDWMFWESIGTGHELAEQPGGGNTRVYDIRAKRKLLQLQEVLVLSHGTANVTTFPLTVFFSGSVLLMLP
jgi:hypothetical protein